MRLKRLMQLGLILAALSVAAGLEAQSQWIQGPILGFIPENAEAIRPVFGVPGASLLGDRLDLNVGIRGAVISPKQDYVLAARTEDSEIVIVGLSGAELVANPVLGIRPGADVIAVSPMGSAAAVYDRASGMVQVIGRLPHAPQLIHEFDASRIPGRGASIAVSDDGAIVLMKFVTTDSVALWSMDVSGAALPIPANHPSAAAFFPNRHDAVVADDAMRGAFLIMDIGGASTPIPLLSVPDTMETFSSLAVSEDGRQVFIADVNSGVVATVDAETGTAALTSCQCRPTGLHRLKGNSVFRLTEVSTEPVMVLDASAGDPRIVVIPPVASAGAEAQ